jgi:hypothetical protein
VKHCLITGAAILLPFTACKAQETAFVRLVGPINDRAVAYVEKQISKLPARSGTSDVMFRIGYSPGGDAKSLFRLVELVTKHADTVFVSGECLSACAEFLYLIDKPITAHRNAAIGFHGNALTNQRLSRTFKVVPNGKCTDWGKQFSAALRAKGVDPGVATQELIRRLGYYKMTNESSVIESGCMTTRSFSKYRFWFPTTAQLKSIFGMKVGGSVLGVRTEARVCADDLPCITQFALKKWGVKPDVIVGDRPVEIVESSAPTR